MTLEIIYVTRHGVRSRPCNLSCNTDLIASQFRSNWVVNPNGEYTASIPSPTGIPSDPALASYGVVQSKELATHLKTLDPPIQRFYSSPFYRCLQTINPAVEAISFQTADTRTHKIRGENGIGEWYGTARFSHPSPAEPQLLKGLFARFDEEYEPVIKPSANGEKIEELHDRSAYALHKIIERSDKEGVKAICICTHAATLIAIGRVLTGRMPENIAEEDFRPFTCGVTTFVRRSRTNIDVAVNEWAGPGARIPAIPWRDGNGVGGGWDVKNNADCTFLSGGEERGW
jgi:transcription factor C subunit 7